MTQRANNKHNNKILT